MPHTKQLFILAALLILLSLPASPAKPASGTGPIFLPLLQVDGPSVWPWEPAGEILLQPAPANMVTVIDDLGRFHVLWDTLLPPHYLYHAYEDAGKWKPPVAIAQPLGASTLLSPPLAGQDGSLDLVWHSDLGPDAPLSQRILYAHFDGVVWQGEEEIYRVPGTAGGQIEAWLQRLPQGELSAVVRDDGFLPRAFQLRRSADTWTQSAPIEPGHPVAVLWPDLLGGIHFYGNTLPEQLFYSYWRNGAFEQQGVQGNGTVLGRELQPDSQNNLHLFWLSSVPVPGGSVTGLTSQCLAPPLDWQPEVTLSGENRVWSLPLSAAGEEELFAATWEEEGFASIRLGLWKGCAAQPPTLIPDLPPALWDVRGLALREPAGRLCILAHQVVGGSRYSAFCAALPQP